MIRTGVRSLAVLIAAFVLTAAAGQAPGKHARVYVGTYTGTGSRGIYLLDFDESSGKWTGNPVLAVATENPSWVALDPSGRFLYAANEVGNFGGKPTGAVSAFAIDAASGHLTFLNQQPSEGADPCHLIVDREGRHALVANYTGGTVAMLPISEDGRLQPASSVRRHTGSGPVRDRQEGAHAHAVLLDRAERFAVSADLGADRVFVDRFDRAGGRLTPNSPDGVGMQPGAGPRHLAWHPSGRALYVLTELASTVSTLRYDPDHGTLESVQTVAGRAAGANGRNDAAEIVVSGDGRFLYASNRGDDNIAVFAIAPATFTLTAVGHVPTAGHEPRNFTIDPTGRWLIAANQKSNSLVVFRIDPVTGLPAAVGQPLTIVEPVCVLFAEK